MRGWLYRIGITVLNATAKSQSLSSSPLKGFRRFTPLSERRLHDGVVKKRQRWRVREFVGQNTRIINLKYYIYI